MSYSYYPPNPPPTELELLQKRVKDLEDFLEKVIEADQVSFYNIDADFALEMLAELAQELKDKKVK